MLAMSPTSSSQRGNLVHAFLTGEKLPLPTIDWTTIPDGYRGTR
jgi:hypothetical protein